MDRAGISTPDPLSATDPDRSFFNNCQPLADGDDAKQYLLGGPDETKGGGAPVWRYTGELMSELYGISVADGNILAAVYDEDEYSLSTYLTQRWNADFVYNPPNKYHPNAGYKLTSQQLPNPFQSINPPIELPCVQDIDSSIEPSTQIFSPPPTISAPQPILPICNHPSTTPTPTSEPTCPPLSQLPKVPLPPDYDYKSAPRSNPHYCPNVQKILDPTSPFSPRQDITGQTERDTYSPNTSKSLPGQCRWVYYTDYKQHPDQWKNLGTLQNGSPLTEMPVQCAIVPVDIMNSRAAAFDSCIQQRIDLNLNAYMTLWQQTGSKPNPQTASDAQTCGPGGSAAHPQTCNNDFQPPCATRFWEQDTAGLPGEDEHPAMLPHHPQRRGAHQLRYVPHL